MLPAILVVHGQQMDLGGLDGLFHPLQHLGAHGGGLTQIPPHHPFQGHFGSRAVLHWVKISDMVAKQCLGKGPAPARSGGCQHKGGTGTGGQEVMALAEPPLL